jgi:hypothetical protein
MQNKNYYSRLIYFSSSDKNVPKTGEIKPKVSIPKIPKLY